LRQVLVVAAVKQNFPKIAPEPIRLLQRGMIKIGVVMFPKDHYTKWALEGFIIGNAKK
jgi:hypothetical protein